MDKVWHDLKPGTIMGVSPWFQLKQEMFTEFEELTLSNDPLHTDPQWIAENTHFKSTIAPGFFTVALLPYLYKQVVTAKLKEVVTGKQDGYFSMNYGFDKIRWVEPVPVNSRIRAEFVVMQVTPRADDGAVVKTKVTVEIEGVSRPGMVAEWLGVLMPDSKRT